MSEPSDFAQSSFLTVPGSGTTEGRRPGGRRSSIGSFDSALEGSTRVGTPTGEEEIDPLVDIFNLYPILDQHNHRQFAAKLQDLQVSNDRKMMIKWDNPVIVYCPFEGCGQEWTCSVYGRRGAVESNLTVLDKDIFEHMGKSHENPPEIQQGAQ